MLRARGRGFQQTQQLWRRMVVMAVHQPVHLKVAKMATSVLRTFYNKNIVIKKKKKNKEVQPIYSNGV